MKAKNLGQILTVVLITLAISSLASAINDPIAYWQFDEGSGGTVYDSAGSNNGTISGAQWTSGKIEGALDFDGINDYIDVPDSPSLDITGDQIAISVWFKPGRTGNQNDPIVSKWFGSDSAYVLYYAVGMIDTIGFGVDCGGTVKGALHPTLVNDTNKWYHIVGVYDGSKIIVYIDGVAGDAVSASGNIDSSSRDLKISGYSSSGADDGHCVSGIIDEVRIYDRTLDTNEVQQLYEQGQPYLVAHWKLDDGTGTVAVDSAGDNDGTLTNGPIWTTGTIDGALQFDGVDDYVDLDDHINEFQDLSEGTVSVWLNKIYTGTSGIYFSAANNTSQIYYSVIADNRLKIRICPLDPPGSLLYWISDDPLPDGWHHFAYTTDVSGNKMYLDGEIITGEYTKGSSSTNAFFSHVPNVISLRIGNMDIDGSGGSSFFDGLVDDLRVYNHALDAAELQQLYHESNPQPALVAHWKLDEGTGTVAVDSAGDNDGTLTYGPIWTTGIMDGALDFDGSNDHVETADLNLDTITVSAWVNVLGGGGERSIVNNYEAAGYGLGYNLYDGGKFHLGVHINGEFRVAFSDTIAQQGQWYHVAGTYDGENGYLFINGIKQTDTFSEIGQITDSVFPILIGANPDAANPPDKVFNGLIDDVRVYNYALDANEVQQLYQESQPEPPEPELVAHWKLDDANGTTAVDSAGDNDGTVNGAIWDTGKIAGALDFDGTSTP